MFQLLIDHLNASHWSDSTNPVISLADMESLASLSMAWFVLNNPDILHHFKIPENHTHPSIKIIFPFQECLVYDFLGWDSLKYHQLATQYVHIFILLIINPKSYKRYRMSRIDSLFIFYYTFAKNKCFI